MTSARKVSSLVARSRRPLNTKSCGVVSMSARRGLAGAEGLVRDDVFEERDVRLHPADAELPQRAVHALEGDREMSGRRP